jgi:hypothetical protein
VQIGDRVRVGEHILPLSIFLDKYEVVLSEKKGPYIILWVKEKR